VEIGVRDNVITDEEAKLKKLIVKLSASIPY